MGTWWWKWLSTLLLGQAQMGLLEGSQVPASPQERRGEIRSSPAPFRTNRLRPEGCWWWQNGLSACGAEGGYSCQAPRCQTSQAQRGPGEPAEAVETVCRGYQAQVCQAETRVRSRYPEAGSGKGHYFGGWTHGSGAGEGHHCGPSKAGPDSPSLGSERGLGFSLADNSGGSIGGYLPRRCYVSSGNVWHGHRLSLVGMEQAPEQVDRSAGLPPQAHGTGPPPSAHEAANTAPPGLAMPSYATTSPGNRGSRPAPYPPTSPTVHGPGEPPPADTVDRRHFGRHPGQRDPSATRVPTHVEAPRPGVKQATMHHPARPAAPHAIQERLEARRANEAPTALRPFRVPLGKGTGAPTDAGPVEEAVAEDARHIPIIEAEENETHPDFE